MVDRADGRSRHADGYDCVSHESTTKRETMATTGGDESPETKWNPARLIPAVGIKGQTEQELRAASSLLAVMVAVPDFSRDILSHIGAPGGRISTYTEVRFDDDEGKTLRPDGAIIVERGQRRWSCLVEVKTGQAELRREQLEAYLDLARTKGFDGLLTISNDIASDSAEVPVTIDQRKLKGLAVRHLSWWRILTAAIVQKEHRGIEDPDQAWILGELIRYLEDERSGASGFADMGDSWTTVRDGARSMTLRQGDAAVRDVADRWEQFVEYMSLDLRQTLGRPVAPLWPRKSTRSSRLIEAARSLAQDGLLGAAIKVPDTAAPLDLAVNLRTRQLNTSTTINAPREGRPQTRINWMLRQAKGMRPDLRIEVRYPNARENPSMLLGGALQHPERLLYTPDPKREPRAFDIALVGDMGRKRGKGPGSFVGDSRAQLLTFYREVLQRIRAWQPPAPRLPSETLSVDASDVPGHEGVDDPLARYDQD